MAFDDSTVVNRLVNGSDALYFSVENDRQQVLNVRTRECVKLPSTLRGQIEAHGGLTVFVARRIGGTQIFACDRRSTRNNVPSRVAVGAKLARHQRGVGRQNASFVLPRRLP